MKKHISIVLALSALVSCSPSVQWVATTSDAAWEAQDLRGLRLVETDSVDAEIDIAHPQQTIDGFGTCFNELGWTSLSHLSEADREAVLKELFQPGVGANFSICRMPVGANDFSRDWYSYNETDGDFEMQHFSIANDCETLVPFIKNALKYNPSLTLWASPWSPPTWMKDNQHYACQPGQNDITPEQVRKEGDNMFVQDARYFKAYALYFAKFIEAYRAENIHIAMVMPQNEFNSCQPFPSCTWRAAALNTFVGEYLGPKMQELGVAVMFGTMERPNAALVDTLLQDPKSSRYITGAGFQWAGKHAIKAIHEAYPSLKLYQTEQECGNGANDWDGCRYAWSLMQHYFNNGTNVYDYWNTSLEEGGMSRWGWAQNSLVTVNREAKTYKFTHEYYLLKHVSHYVRQGAQFLAAKGQFTNLLAFKNTNGEHVLVIHNDKGTEIAPVIKIGNKKIKVTLQPNSFNTIVL